MPNGQLTIINFQLEIIRRHSVKRKIQECNAFLRCKTVQSVLQLWMLKI